VNEERHIALPKLFGAPAYARPPVVPVAPVERPFDPDDLPLESERTRDEHEIASELAAHPYGAVAISSDHVGGGGRTVLRGRAFRLRLPGRPNGGR
jgi:hypothetical protein